ncbi:MAG TPA: cupin domain-containing protein [Acidimicrobiia bacterium]|nr:cupin domain-containing protein [Acidimicrobiia bacterium]
MTADEIVDLLGLAPMPVEGGMWAQTWRDDHGTAIYFLLRPGDFSALHRLDTPELWHHYAGATVQMLLLRPDGSVRRPLLGDDFASEARPFVAVPAGDWMAAETTGDWSLVGTTMAPPFDPAGFELGDAGDLATRFPAAAHDIPRYVREEHP